MNSSWTLPWISIALPAVSLSWPRQDMPNASNGLVKNWCTATWRRSNVPSVEKAFFLKLAVLKTPVLVHHCIQLYIYIYLYLCLYLYLYLFIYINVIVHIYIYVYVLEIGKLYNEHFGMNSLTFSIRQQRRRGVVVAIYPNKLSKWVVKKKKRYRGTHAWWW
jgi:hypothetical protein